ncbi:hypothetical protein QNH46_10015 [Paenibacillus woosongensis]|uniref:Uncharacterized protein n=1 Tax=Paenibacillus woosongensis TaxID=307580 RepID=A0AA95I7W9_9BACL|nr:hypothetical protein [Paenibacillus woosongensis]WHX50946.1 hypothetical protein QNH46_10015 [Paenibacillus woosongensis]
MTVGAKLFWNMGIFVDEYGLSPSIVNGGDFWLLMDWLRLLFLFLLCIISGVNLLNEDKE